MGPDTMNTVLIPLKNFLKNHTEMWVDRLNEDKLPYSKNINAKLSITIGNFTLVPAYLNPSRGTSNYVEDYWDLTLKYLSKYGYREIRYPENWKSMSKEHLCFDKMYDSKKGEKDLFSDRYETFLKNVCRFIRRRSLFMAAMLKLAVEHEKLYKDLMERICVDEVINGYKEVFEFLTKAENELREEEIELFNRTYDRIKKIK